MNYRNQRDVDSGITDLYLLIPQRGCQSSTFSSIAAGNETLRYLLCVKMSIWRSSLVYNTSARYERHECDINDINLTQVQQRTTRVQHKCDTSEIRATQVQHECDTCATQTARKLHEWKYIFASPILAIWQKKD